MRKFSMKAIAIAAVVTLTATMAVSVSPAAAECYWVHDHAISGGQYRCW
jgi:hypothetical protein